MGATCFDETSKKNARNYKKNELNSSNSQFNDSLFSNEIYIKEIDNLSKIIEKYEKELNELSKSIDDKKAEIFKKMDESDNDQVKGEIDEYYKFLNLKKEKNDNYNSFKNIKSDLDNLLEKNKEEFDEKRIPTDGKKKFRKKIRRN